MSHKPSVVALRVSLLYAVVGALWILFSDRLAGEFIRDPEQLTRLAIFKGWCFVAFTGALLYFLLRRLLVREAEKQRALKAEEALTKLQRDALEMLAKGQPLNATLEVLVRGLEAQMPETAASILLLDWDGTQLRHGAAPALPAEYTRAIDGVVIGPKAGSCGTAAFRGSPVFASDIATDELWSEYKQLALPHGLRACWSMPIFDEQKKVLGTFAVYHFKPGLPTDNQVRIVETITHTAAAAISKARTEESLRENEERFHTLLKQASDAIFVHDTEGRMVDANEQACASLGYSREELMRLTAGEIEVGFSQQEIEDICRNLRPGQFKITNGWHRRKDGTKFPVEASLSIHHLRGRQLTLALVRNATERKEYEEKLAHSVSLLRGTIEASASAILVVDTDGKVTVFNNHFLQMWRIPAALAATAKDEELLNFVIEQLADPAEFGQRVREMYANPAAHSLDTILFKDGRVVERLSHPQMLGDKIIGRVWSFHDVTDQRRSAAALRFSEERYRTLFESSPAGILRQDETGKIIDINDAYCRLSGYSRKELIGNSVEILVPKDQTGIAVEHRRKILAGGVHVHEVENLTKDHRSIHIKIVETCVTFPDGHREILCNTTDVTRQKQAEAELRSERELLRTLVDLAPDFIFIKDTESRFLLVNSTLAACYRKTPAQMLGHTDADFLPADLAARTRASEQQVMETASFLSVEDTITFADGQSRTVFTNMVAFRNSPGRVCGLVGIGRDITGHRSAEKSMRLQSTALEAAANAIVITDQAGTIEWVNPAFTRGTGYSLADCLGKNPRELLRSGQHDREFYQQLWHTILAGQVWQGEMVNRRKDGSLYREEMTITPLLDRGNRTTHFVAIKQDITERKRMEEELRAAGERTKFYMNRMPLGFIAWDRDYRVAEWNAEAEKIFGWKAGEAIGRHAFELIIPPDDQTRAIEKWKNRLTEGSPASVSVSENITRDGRRITCEWHGTPWHDAQGNDCGCLSIVNDITEVKRIEETYAREQARFKLIFDTAPVGIAFHTKHPDGNVTRAINNAHLRICGLTREQHDEPGIYARITHPDDRLAQQKLNAEVQAGTHKQFSLEKRYLHPDGKVVWVSFSYQRENYPDGTVEELTTVVDITERKAVEQQLRQLAVIVESSEDAIIGQSLEGVVTSWNRGAQTIFGYTASEAIGGTLRQLFPDELKQEEADLLARIGRGENIEHFQTERVRRDGKRIRVSATLSPLKDGQGEIVGAATIARNITHQHLLEEQLRQSQKMEAIGQLAGGVAHDFNNILAVIQMQAELARIDGLFSAEQADCLDEIQTAAKRGANLTRQLLLFSRRQRLQPRELDLSDSITGMTKMLWRVLGEDIQIQFKYAAQPLFIYADAGMMDQVVMNLTLNSRDAMPNGGQLVIETAAVEFDQLAAAQSAQARPGSFVRLSVGDIGTGIPPEILPRIFEPFFTTKDVGKGTGLGLATVFSIVQQHQGWIDVDSKPGHGTTFHIYLPRLARHSEQPKAAASGIANADGGSETILLVEDDEALRASVHKRLAQLGYRLLEAPSGAAALQVWQKHRDEIQLLLTDLVMPGGVSGRELGERLLREKPQLKVIYMSGYSAEVFNKELAASEGIAFLAKPFPAQTLARTIRTCLDKP